MNDKIFFPDYATRRVGRRHHGLFKFFEGEEWHQVSDAGGPVPFTCQADALGAAKEALRKALNPVITGHRSQQKAFIEAAASWFANKHESKARESIARKRGVREVVFVEVKGKRNAKNS